MKYIIALPDHPFYLWQMLVQITNFRTVGIEKDVHFLICVFNNSSSRLLTRIVNNGDLKCHFHIYPDTRPLHGYSSSMRPWMMFNFLSQNEDIQRGAYMYLDPDVVFTRTPDFDALLSDHKWYISGANSYMDVHYIKSKGEDVYKLMTDIVGIPPALVEKYDKHAGGVQYIFKNAPISYWQKVYVDCENLFTKVTKLNNEKIAESKAKGDNPVYHEIQIWCADMWACLWNAWLMGYKMEIHPSMEFIWAGWHIRDWERLTIFHNAGVPAEDGRNFAKGTHQYSPFKKEIYVHPESVSYKYLEIIKQTEKMFPDLIW